MFFGSWYAIGRIVLIGLCAYVALITLLRVTGKRTLSKMNAFDLIVTVALGSTLSTIVISEDVELSDGIAALATLVALQFAVTWTSVRSARVRRWVKSEPRAMLVDGTLQEDAMRDERITPDEVLAAIRAAGHDRFDRAALVTLETDGSLSVVSRSSEAPA